MSAPVKGLGRVPQYDPRNHQYPLTALMREEPTRTWRYMRTGPILDQHNTGTCVGHAWRQFLSSARLMTKSGPDAFTIYREACLLDPWPQNDSGDLQWGTSTLAGVKALQQRGHIEGYYWSWSAEEVKDWLLLGKGVIVIGSWWTSGMSQPDAQGIIRYDGHVQGGHAYILSGVNTRSGLFRVVNSWGTAWGENGRAWLPGEDVQQLLDDEGEAVTAIEQRLA